MAEEAQPTTEEKVEPRGKLLTSEDVEWGNETRLVESHDVEADEEPEEEVEQPEVELVEPVINAVDPGEFEPKDYSFEVTVFDEDGNKPRNVKVNSVEAWDELLDRDPNFGSATALMKAQRKATRMESGLERDQQTWQDKKDTYESEVGNVQARQEATTQYVNEINYLVGKGELPKVSAQNVNANWGDPEVAKQAGVKEQKALLDYMSKENQARINAGLKPMTSILDAFNSFQLDQSKKTVASNRTSRATARKEAGARVAGSSTNAQTIAPKGIMVGRGGSLRDIGGTNWT